MRGHVQRIGASQDHAVVKIVSPLTSSVEVVAEAYAGQAHYAEAEEFYGRVLAILTPRLGSDNPVVQRVLTEQARARRQLELSGAKKS